MMVSASDPLPRLTRPEIEMAGNLGDDFRFADDADNLVEIEINDLEAVQHLDAPRDGGEAVPAAPR